MKIAIIILLLIKLSAESFINVYPKYKSYETTDDCGEPLFLTPYLTNGKIEDGRKMAAVLHPQMNWLTSFSGYFTVDKKFNSNLFFWFFPAKIDPDNAPVVLWLQGGPGASSLFGLFTENGPFYISSKNILKPRKYSWHLNHNLIYIDNPVGTGFSFVDNDDGYARNENDVGNNLYEAVKQFFQLFPILKKNSFYITGESYAGKYVPAVSHRIDKMNEHASDEDKINLKGLAIGNGLSDPLHQLKYGDYLYQIGLIDENGKNIFHEYEKKAVDFIAKKDFSSAFEIFDELINMDELPSGSLFKNMTGFDIYFNYLHTVDNGESDRMAQFVQTCDIRKAIHVGNLTFHGTDKENLVEKYLKNDIMDSVGVWISELLSKYRIVIYNGQMDVIVAYPLTVNYLHKLKFKDRDIYLKAPRYIWKVDKEIAGYAKEAGNLVEVLVRNAGHMVPADQPKWTLDMLLRLTMNKSFAYKAQN